MSFTVWPAVIRAGRSRIIDVPAGTISMWSGTIASIPAGWALCDGGGGRPDLRDRFSYGTDSPGSTGGSTSHSHTLTTDGHTHTLNSGGAHTHNRGAEGGELVPDNDAATIGDFHSHSASSSDDHNHGGLSSASNVFPSFYTLAFIIKE